MNMELNPNSQYFEIYCMFQALGNTAWCEVLNSLFYFGAGMCVTSFITFTPAISLEQIKCLFS